MKMNLSISTACSRACAPYFRARVFLSRSIKYRCPYSVLDHRHKRPGSMFLIALLVAVQVPTLFTALHGFDVVNQVAEEMAPEDEEAEPTVARRTVYVRGHRV